MVRFVEIGAFWLTLPEDVPFTRHVHFHVVFGPVLMKTFLGSVTSILRGKAPYHVRNALALRNTK